MKRVSVRAAGVGLVLALAALSAGCTSGRLKEPKQEASSYTGPKVELKTKIAPGKYLMSTLQTVKAEAENSSKEDVTSLTQSLDVTMEARAAESSGAQQVHYLVKHLTLDGKSGRETIRFDSSDPGKSRGALAMALRELIDWEEAVKYSAGDKSFEIVSSDSPEDDEELDARRTVVKSLSWDSRNGEAGRLLPTGPVGPGDRWTGKATMKHENLGDMEMDCNVLCQDVRDTPQGKVVVVDYVGSAVLTNQGAVDNVKCDKADLYIQGRLLFNLDLGLCTEVANTTEFVGDMSKGREKGRLYMTVDYKLTVGKV
jgi:hypothetical protein